MTAQQKRPIVFMIIDIIIFSIYYLLISGIYEQTVISTGELRFWGATLLILVPILIISRIVLYIIYSIINTAISKKKEEKFLIDEFGKIIKLKAKRNFGTTFIVGFLLAMGLLVGGASVHAMFHLLFFSIFGAFIVNNLSEFYYIKKGC